MSIACHDHASSAPSAAADRPYRRVLWLALVLNAAMFVVEIGAGAAAQSVALWADALDFLGDAATYGITLVVLGMAIRWRARAALLKGASMGLFGLWVIGAAASNALAGTVPEAPVMGLIGLLALAVNVGVAIMLYRHRGGDANRRSVWLCSRNDALGNIAVVLAAAGVAGTGTGWPDIAVAAVMAALALSSSVLVIRQAMGELRQERLPPTGSEPAR